MRVVLILVLTAGVAAAEDDAYADLIRHVVKEDGVDYELLRKLMRGELARELFRGLEIQKHLMSLGDVSAQDLWSQADLINYYNAMVVWGVVKGKSPKEACKVLEEYEAKITDPRIHFALHRAARSSPKLRYYKQATLDEDLTQAVRVYLSDKRHNEFDTARLKAELSELFYWHRAEFVASVKEKSGAPFQLFLARYAPRASFARRLRSSRWTIRYRKFDWTLNESGVVPEEEGGSPLLWIYLVPAGLLLLFGLYSFRMLFRRRAGSLGEP